MGDQGDEIGAGLGVIVPRQPNRTTMMTFWVVRHRCPPLGVGFIGRTAVRPYRRALGSSGAPPCAPTVGRWVHRVHRRAPLPLGVGFIGRTAVRPCRRALGSSGAPPCAPTVGRWVHRAHRRAPLPSDVGFIGRTAVRPYRSANSVRLRWISHNSSSVSPHNCAACRSISASIAHRRCSSPACAASCAACDNSESRRCTGLDGS